MNRKVLTAFQDYLFFFLPTSISKIWINKDAGPTCCPASLRLQMPFPWMLRHQLWNSLVYEFWSRNNTASALKTYKFDWNKTSSRLKWLSSNILQIYENIHSLCSLRLVETCAGWIWSKYLPGRFFSSALILHINPNPLSKLFAFCKFSS